MYETVALYKEQVIGFTKHVQAKVLLGQTNARLIHGPKECAGYSMYIRLALKHRIGEIKQIESSDRDVVLETIDLDDKATPAKQWNALCIVAEPSVYDRSSNKRKHTRVKTYKIYPDKYNEENHWPPQAVIVAKKLMTLADRGPLHESSIQELLIDMVQSGELVTKQPPLRIFQYYKPQFVAAGLIKEIK